MVVFIAAGAELAAVFLVFVLVRAHAHVILGVTYTNDDVATSASPHLSIVGAAVAVFVHIFA